MNIDNLFCQDIKLEEENKSFAIKIGKLKCEITKYQQSDWESPFVEVRSQEKLQLTEDY